MIWSGALNPHVFALSRFPPSEVSEPPVPAHSPPAVALAMIVFPIVRSPGLNISPPRFAPFLAMVTLFNVAVMVLFRPPPSVTAVLPLMVTSFRLSVPSFWMPAPIASDVLLLIVARVSVATPVLYIPPPRLWVVLPSSVRSVAVSVPSFWMPPPPRRPLLL